MRGSPAGASSFFLTGGDEEGDTKSCYKTNKMIKIRVKGIRVFGTGRGIVFGFFVFRKTYALRACLKS